ncbi:hypothetical protein E2C01_037832 [Portunus trituberculatus]|uniref:Uncharacterized protein n=1 Tax=Portunus trituberculatus TaxID=210409 RepID=A0A5B7FGW1_PORTR|nr:hypothetical protein [Portunus trituberculatus]
MERLPGTAKENHYKMPLRLAPATFRQQAAVSGGKEFTPPKVSCSRTSGILVPATASPSQQEVDDCLREPGLELSQLLLVYCKLTAYRNQNIACKTSVVSRCAAFGRDFKRTITTQHTYVPL